MPSPTLQPVALPPLPPNASPDGEIPINRRRARKSPAWITDGVIYQIMPRAFDQVLHGVRSETPAPGEVILWHLYNMGYVVKTDRHCFGIDLHHRRDVELVPDLDFLIVTHNAVTMSRMHRLYGVTMAEQGVSQLVSVDLARAELLLAAQ